MEFKDVADRMFANDKEFEAFLERASRQVCSVIVWKFNYEI